MDKNTHDRWFELRQNERYGLTREEREELDKLEIKKELWDATHPPPDSN